MKALRVIVRRLGSIMMLALVCLGCGDGSSLVSVTGKVTLDGEPLPGADVSFRPHGKGETA